MTVIDAHQHFWDPTRASYPWMEATELAPIRRTFTPTDLRPLLDAAGIDGCLFVQCRHDEAETEEQLAATLTDPWILGVVGWVDLEAVDVTERIARLRSMPGGNRLVGIRHIVHDELDAAWLERPAVIRGLRAVAAAGLTYDLLVRARELPAAIAAVRAVPEGRFVLDHAAKPPIARGWDPAWAALITELANEPNVFCKLSGLVTEAHWTSWRFADLESACRLAIEAFGSARLLYGSDWPVCLLAAPYEVVKATFDRAVTGLSQTERAAVLGGNAIAAYKLDVNRHAALNMERK
ncbi:MAG: amidohydrolase family protein [Novosphingobium sp.]|uniref:amidohydrolase family protein n=1 Tax=Novosphingobium sp. TaxID=1874826 RepID=UPI0022CB5C9F|nr:amidohydrolase family protein [Novosphingobium sp.]MCZ8036364.1 amidohydrolase family protein [Novosphingobium sp.]